MFRELKGEGTRALRRLQPAARCLKAVVQVCILFLRSKGGALAWRSGSRKVKLGEVLTTPESTLVELAGIPEKGHVIFQGVLMPVRLASARDITHQSFRSLPQVPTKARCLVPGH